MKNQTYSVWLKIKLNGIFKINTGVACFVVSNIYTMTYTQGVKSFRGKLPAAAVAYYAWAQAITA